MPGEVEEGDTRLKRRAFNRQGGRGPCELQAFLWEEQRGQAEAGPAEELQQEHWKDGQVQLRHLR